VGGGGRSSAPWRVQVARSIYGNAHVSTTRALKISTIYSVDVTAYENSHRKTSPERVRQGISPTSAGPSHPAFSIRFYNRGRLKKAYERKTRLKRD
jgi:hypothetical protein